MIALSACRSWPPAAPGSALGNTATITARNLRRVGRVPTLVALATIQPVMLVVLFTYAFGGAVRIPGVTRYIDYLLPGVLVLAIGFGASQTGVAVADDLASGMIDRFRSLPIASASVLAGRVAADAVRNIFVTGLMIAVGSAIGFRFHAGAAAASAAVCLALAAGIAFSWLNLLLGLLIRDAETAGLAGLFPIIILTFTSSTLVPRGHDARMASGLRQDQPDHCHSRRAASPLPWRPHSPGGRRGDCLDRRASARHDPPGRQQLPARDIRLNGACKRSATQCRRAR